MHTCAELANQRLRNAVTFSWRFSYRGSAAIRLELTFEASSTYECGNTTSVGAGVVAAAGPAATTAQV